MKKYILEHHEINFNRSCGDLPKFLRYIENVEDFSILSAELFILDEWGSYDPRESFVFDNKEEALKAFAEKTFKATGGYRDLDLEGWTLEVENDGHLEGEIATHEFKGADNPFYVLAHENSLDNNTERCERLADEYEATWEDGQPLTEWAQLIEQYNQANGTNEVPENIDTWDVIQWTLATNYFKFEF